MNVSQSQTLEAVIFGFISTWTSNSQQLDGKSLLSWGRILKLAARGATDVVIWQSLLKSSGPRRAAGNPFSATPPRAPRSPPVFSAARMLPTAPAPSNTRIRTPIQSNAGGCSLGMKTDQDLDPRLCRELHGLMYANTPGFFDAFFHHQKWTPAANDVFRRAKEMHLSPTGWSAWPLDTNQDAVLSWFTTCVNNLLTRTTCR